MFTTNDVLFGKLRPYLAKVAVPTFGGCCSSEIIVLRPTVAVLRRFLYYCLLAEPFVRWINSFSYGTKMPRIDPERLMNARIPIPPIEMQAAIVRWLDEATRRVDGLLERNRRVRPLVLDHQNTRLADLLKSAVGRRVRLKSVAKRITSGSRGWAAYYDASGPAGFLRVGNLRRDWIDLKLDDLQRISPPLGPEAVRSKTHCDDVLISITANVGAVGVVPPGIGEVYVNQHVALLRLDTGACDSRYVALALTAPEGQQQLRSFLYGGTKEGLRLEDVLAVDVPLPPVSEQREVVEAALRIRQTSELILRKVSAADMQLRQHRLSLISGAVTGRINTNRGSV